MTEHRPPSDIAFAIRLAGDDMMPRYRRGAVLYIDLRQPTQPGDEVCVATEGSLTVGILERRDHAEAAAVLRWLNHPCLIEAVLWIGRVVPFEELLRL